MHFVLERECVRNLNERHLPYSLEMSGTGICRSVLSGLVPYLCQMYFVIYKGPGDSNERHF